MATGSTLDDMVRSDRTGGALVHLTTSADHSENSTKNATTWKICSPLTFIFITTDDDVLGGKFS